MIDKTIDALKTALAQPIGPEFKRQVDALIAAGEAQARETGKVFSAFAEALALVGSHAPKGGGKK